MKNLTCISCSYSLLFYIKSSKPAIRAAEEWCNIFKKNATLVKENTFLVSVFFFFFDNNHNYVKTTTFLTRLRMGIWLLTDGGPGRAERLPSLKSVTDIYPTMMKIGIVIPYLKKIKKISIT